MKEAALYLLSDSPSDLEGQLKNLAQNQPLKGRAVYLAVTDNDIFCRPFMLESSQGPVNPDAQVSMQAVQLLSLPGGDIVLDYQIGQESKRGIFICAARKRLEEYQQVLSKYKARLVMVAPYALVATNYFLSQPFGADKQYFLLDCFQASKAILGVFTKYNCILMRSVHYDSLESLKSEVDSSILSACALSRVKQCDGFYYYGDYEKKDQLLNLYRTSFNGRVFPAGAIDIAKGFGVKHPAFPLHLLRHEFLGPRRYRYLVLGLTVLLAAVLLMCAGVGLLLQQQQEQIRQLQEITQNIKGL